MTHSVCVAYYDNINAKQTSTNCCYQLEEQKLWTAHSWPNDGLRWLMQKFHSPTPWAMIIYSFCVVSDFAHNANMCISRPLVMKTNLWKKLLWRGAYLIYSLGMRVQLGNILQIRDTSLITSRIRAMSSFNNSPKPRFIPRNVDCDEWRPNGRESTTFGWVGKISRLLRSRHDKRHKALLRHGFWFIIQK